MIRFNPEASNTFLPSNQSINLSYGLAWMKGVLGYDTVRVSWKQGAEPGQALRVTTAHKTDTGPDGKSLPSESP